MKINRRRYLFSIRSSYIWLTAMLWEIEKFKTWTLDTQWLFFKNIILSALYLQLKQYKVKNSDFFFSDEKLDSSAFFIYKLLLERFMIWFKNCCYWYLFSCGNATYCVWQFQSFQIFDISKRICQNRKFHVA